MPRISGSSEEIIRTASPCAASSLISRWISALAPTSMPRVGSSMISSRGLVASHLPSTTFCWLPPESLPTICSGPRARMPKRAMASVASASSSPRSMKPRRAIRRSTASDTFWRRVIGRMSPGCRDPRARRRCRAAWPRAALPIRDRLAVEQDLARASPGVMPNTVCASSLRPEPISPARPTISPARTVKADAAHHGRRDQVAHLEHRRAGLGRELGEQMVDDAADHHRDQLGLAGLGRRAWVPTYSPSRSTVTRSASAKISAMRWLM